VTWRGWPRSPHFRMPSDLPATTRLSAGYSRPRGAAPIKTICVDPRGDTRFRTELFSIFRPLHRLKRTVTRSQQMDEWLAVKAERHRDFFRGGVPEDLAAASSSHRAIFHALILICSTAVPPSECIEETERAVMMGPGGTRMVQQCIMEATPAGPTRCGRGEIAARSRAGC
jgi:hypothetical protein